jgi:hypothetical protein
MEQTIQQNNPLKQYFRAVKMYIGLPSGTSYYQADVVEFTSTGEVGVMAMTGKDEIILKNPDALYNGEALIEVISSCVPAVKNPRKLLTNDIDALITAIRAVTFKDSLESEIKCPACGEVNLYKMDLQYALDGMETLEPEYVINLDSGVSVFVKPYLYPDLVNALQSQLERKKIGDMLDNDKLTEKEKSDLFSKAFKTIAVSKFQLLRNAILKIVDEANGVNVTNPEFIGEFLENIDKTSVENIDKLVTEINQVGIKRTFTAICEKCNHQWENAIDFNPVNFL